MDALLQRVERERARERHDELAVEDETWVFRCPSAATISGKYRPSGWPAFDCSATSPPSRNARQRKPSHLGSYCHCGPSGTSETARISMGG